MKIYHRTNVRLYSNAITTFILVSIIDFEKNVQEVTGARGVVGYLSRRGRLIYKVGIKRYHVLSSRLEAVAVAVWFL